MRTRHKIGMGVVVLAVCILAAFLTYTSQYYHTDQSVENKIAKDETLSYLGEDMVLTSAGADTGIIFYPGAKVETSAYYPICKRLQQEGVQVILVEMPFHLAFFGSNAADEIIQSYPEIENWYLMGHSLGGAMASSYASKHADQVTGVILLGAYRYGSYPLDHMLTIYGSEDGVLNRDKVDYEENVVVLEGGNHAQFGNYGEQKGDGTAGITAEEQQQQAVEEILSFIKK